MIVLGIAPGLRSLAYSVVGFYRGADERGDLIDADVLRGTHAAKDASWTLLLDRGRPHRLIMSVVFERHPPAVLAIGPPMSKKEPKLHVESVSTLMEVMAKAFNVPVVRFPDKQSLISAFPVREPLRNMACRYVRAECLSNTTSLLVATATAAAGALELRRRELTKDGFT